MPELGKTLKNARIEQGISLDQLEEMTKIRKRYLTAIEEQNYDILPGSFYVRAFIKNYAENVGLNPDDILEMYKNELPARSSLSSMESVNTRKVRSSFNFEKWGKWASAIIMVSFLLLIVALIYYYMIHNDNPESRVADQTPVTDERDVIGVPDNPSDENNENDDREGDEIGSDETPVNADETSTDDDEGIEPEVVLTNAQGNTDVYTVTAPEQLEVMIEVIDQLCWVTVKEDHVNGDIWYSAMMTSDEDDGNDETETWVADHSLFIVLGRASDVRVTVNGVELEPFDIASVRNLQLNFVDANTIETEEI